jgi:hypothetical protein
VNESWRGLDNQWPRIGLETVARRRAATIILTETRMAASKRLVHKVIIQAEWTRIPCSKLPTGGPTKKPSPTATSDSPATTPT